MRVVNETRKTFTKIPFILYRLLDAQVVRDRKGTSLNFKQSVAKLTDENRFQVNSIQIRLSKPLSPGASIEIIMNYRGSVYGYPEIMRYVQDRVSEQYSLIRPDGLSYPVLACPTLECYMNTYQSTFSYDVRVTVPSGYVAACGGILMGTIEQEGTTTFLYQSKVPTWRIDIAVAKFNVLRDEENKLLVYALPEDEQGAVAVLEGVKRAIGFYSQMFGGVRDYQGYTVIEIPDGWGSQAGDLYILQTAAAFEDARRIPGVYHELAHTWNVKAKPGVQRCRWFDEGFASYFDALAVREFQGQKALEDKMASYREIFIQRVQKDEKNYSTPIAEYGRYELGENSYLKGPWVLYVLHQIVGEERFRQIIRRFLSEFKNRPADFKDFQKVAEQVADKDLSKFFGEWIMGTASSKYLIDRIPVQEIAQMYQ